MSPELGGRDTAERRFAPPPARVSLGYNAAMIWLRQWLTISLGLGLTACVGGDDGGPSQETEGPATSAGTADTNPADSGSDGPEDCVVGQVGCTCTAEDTCIGGSYCIEGECVLGPQINIGESRSVVGGVFVPHEVEVMADEFSWSQESGPPVEILGAETLNIAIAVPADAPPGDVIRLRLEASRNGVTLEEFWEVRVLEAEFENALPGIADPAQLGTTEGLAFGPSGMYVVSTEGFVSLFNDDGEFVESYDVGGTPVGASRRDETLIIANAGLGAVQQLNLVSGNVSVLFDTLAGGGPLGAVNFPLPDGGDLDDPVFVSTRADQTVLRYDGTGATSVILDDPTLVNPNALTFGPEGNAIYVGTVGHVWRVPLLDGGGTGEPEDYLDLGDDTGITYEVDGLAFDEGNNLWVGCPNAQTLFVAHYSVMGPATVSRRFEAPAAGLSGFVNLRFGGGDFDDVSLYYTNLGDGTVGRLRVGLDSL